MGMAWSFFFLHTLRILSPPKYPIRKFMRLHTCSIKNTLPLTLDDQFSGSLFRSDDIERGRDLLDMDDVLVRLIRPRDCQFQVLTVQQVW